MTSPSVYINGLSIGTGGGYTVAREVLRHVALARPEWRVVMGAIQDHPLHEELRAETLPDNAELQWAPAKAANRFARRSYERGELAAAIRSQGFDTVLQLNGMVIPGLETPTLAHFQDPFPFRPEAWNGWRDRVASAFKRRACATAVRRAAACGWTSHYLKELICGRVGVEPRRSIVFYNGVPDSWIERAAGPLPPLEARPMEIATVSNVSVYKRQSLVIEALAELRQRPGLETLEYRIIGAVTDDYRAELRRLAESLGVGGAVHIEGRVSDARVQEVLSRARAMPLMSVCESFGIPPVEAMTFGAPVVIADCCALPEVCQDAGLRVRMDDRDHLIQQLHQVLTDPPVADRLRAAGVARVHDFRWALIGQRMADCLDEIR